MSIGRIGFAALSLLAAGAANAISLNPNGLGEVLLFPYYTVNQHDTLFSIANDGDVGKVVKVRFREGLNSRTAFDVFVFLAPHDTWVAGVGADAATGGAALTTSDHSCTLPALTPGQAFSTSGFTGDLADGGSTDASRTREGWIEVIAAGDIVPGSATDSAITPVQTGQPGEAIPGGCDQLSQAGIVRDLAAPTPLLYGSAVIIDVPQGTFYGYTPDALSGFSSVPLLTAVSGADAPSLDQANSGDSAAVARANLLLQNGTTLALDYDRGIDAVSAVLMKQSITNDYLADPHIGGSTDWVITFPTRAYYVDKQLYPSLSVAPFVDAAHSGESKISIVIQPYDRESGFDSVPACAPLSPVCPPPPPNIDRATNVLAYVDPTAADPSESGVLNSPSPLRVPYLFGTSGRARVSLDVGDGGHALTGGEDANRTLFALTGLPATGFMVYNIINTQAGPGLLANYGGAFAHRATVACAGDQVHCP